MPRITKELLKGRADYSFGDLVYYHLFKHGTRPEGDPSASAGRVWEMDAVCELLGLKTEKTLRNWIADRNVPDSIVPLSNLLFGNDERWNDARRELQEKFEQAKAGKWRKPAAAAPPEVSEEPEELPEEEAPQDEAQDAPQEKPEPRQPLPSPVYLSEPPRSPLPKYAARAFVVGLAGFVVVYGWMHWKRSQPGPEAPQQKVAATNSVAKAPASVTHAAEPKSAAPPPSKRASAPAAKPMPPAAEKAPRPVQPKPTVQPPPAAPHKEAAQPARPAMNKERQHVDAQQMASDKLAATLLSAALADEKRRDQEAARLDSQGSDTNAEQQLRERDARIVAAMGYRLRENMSVEKDAFKNLLTDSVADCALACTHEKCDAFGWYRGQYSYASRKPRYCYLFRKPFITGNYSGMALGEPVTDSRPRLTDRATIDAIKRMAATRPVPTENDNGVLHCSGGPVKVTGFKLQCDHIMGGGTQLGSHRLRYTVNNINECAAKCRPISNCVGFTYNSGDPEGERACQIFGGSPIPRKSNGWISGVREP